MLLLLLLIFGGYFLTKGNGWEDYREGREKRLAMEMFETVESGSVTEVRVFLLLGKEEDKELSKFSVGRWTKSYPVYASTTVKGEELEELVERWRSQQPYGTMALCHYPAYGFELYQGTKLIRKAGLCWGCMNFSYAVFPGREGLHEFHAKGDEGRRLLEFCNRLFPGREIEDEH